MERAVEELEQLAYEFAQDGWGPVARIIERRAQEIERGGKITPVAKKYDKNLYRKPDKSKPKEKKNA